MHELIYEFSCCILSQSIVNWASAYDPLDKPLMTNDEDVPTVSAGKVNAIFVIIPPANEACLSVHIQGQLLLNV